MLHMYPNIQRMYNSIIGAILLAGVMQFIDSRSLFQYFHPEVIGELLFVFVCVLVLVFFLNSIIQQVMRRALAVCMFFLIAWFFVAMCQTVVFPHESVPERYLVYAYYVAPVVVPNLTLYAMMNTHLPRERTVSRWWLATLVVSTVVIALLFTNDLHQLAFRFPQGLDRFHDRVAGPLYYLLLLWMFLLVAASCLVLFLKCRTLYQSRVRWFPFVGALLTFVYTSWFAMGRPFFPIWHDFYPPAQSFTIVYLITIAGCIRSGLIPVNFNNIEHFEASTISAIILDDGGRPHFRTRDAADATLGQALEAEKAPLYLNEDSRLHAMRLPGGHILWQDDLTALNKIRAALAEIQTELAEEQDLLQAEAELTRRQAKVNEQNRLYTMLAASVEPQLKKIDALLHQADPGDPKTLGPLMAEACVYKAYVKRRCNLMLLAHDSPDLHPFELESSILESLDYLELFGKTNSFSRSVAAESFPAESLLLAYEIFEAAVEYDLRDLTSLYVTLNVREGDLLMKMNLEGVGVPHGSAQWVRTAQERKGRLYIQPSEGTVFFTLYLPGGGDRL